MDAIMVFIGGGIGSLTRFIMFRQFFRWFPAVPSYAVTFIVNAIGSLVIGYLFAYFVTKSANETLRFFWMVGFLGGLTTFSTLALDVLQLTQEQSLTYAITIFFTHTILAASLVFVGYRLYQA